MSNGGDAGLLDGMDPQDNERKQKERGTASQHKDDKAGTSFGNYEPKKVTGGDRRKRDTNDKK